MPLSVRWSRTGSHAQDSPLPDLHSQLKAGLAGRYVLEALVSLDSTFPVSNSILGPAYLVQGRQADAVRVFERGG